MNKEKYILVQEACQKKQKTQKKYLNFAQKEFLKI